MFNFAITQAARMTIYEILCPRNILRCSALGTVWENIKINLDHHDHHHIPDSSQNHQHYLDNTWTVFKVDGKQQGNPPWPWLAPIIKTEILLGQSPGLNVSWSMANPPLLAFPSNTSRKVFLMSTATWDQEDQAPHKFDCNHSMWIRSKVTNIEWENAVTWLGCHW